MSLHLKARDILCIYFGHNKILSETVLFKKPSKKYTNSCLLFSNLESDYKDYAKLFSTNWSKCIKNLQLPECEF